MGFSTVDCVCAVSNVCRTVSCGLSSGHPPPLALPVRDGGTRGGHSFTNAVAGNGGCPGVRILVRRMVPLSAIAHG